MIPQFPEFKKLELSDKVDVEEFTSKFPPYSDFNFVSMWSWDFKGEMRISQLHENLVVRFTDYVTGEPFYSFIGDSKVDETVESLLELSKKEGLKQELKLVPEDCVKNLDSKNFKIYEDMDNFDYIYNISELSALKGSKYETHRNLINQFSRNHLNMDVKVINFREIDHKNDILNLYNEWLKNKKEKLSKADHNHELLALNRLLNAKDLAAHKMICLAVYVGGTLVGFIINENIKDHSMIHFEKAHTNYKGSFPILMQQNSKILENINQKYLNFQQDLGIQSLKFTKNKLRPSYFLKKYIVTY